MRQQFEDPEDAGAAIDAIMDGTFEGELLMAGRRCTDVKRPGVLGRRVAGGGMVSRFTHPESRVAMRHWGDDPSAPVDFVALDRRMLEAYFKGGMVVVGSKGHDRLKDYENEVRAKQAADRITQEQRLRDLRVEILENCDEGTRQLLEQVLGHAEMHNVHLGEPTLQTISQMSEAELRGVTTMREDPFLVFLSLQKGEPEQAPAPRM